MSDTDQPANIEPNDDGIRTEDLGYGGGAPAQQGGGLGAALPDIGGPPTGTGEQVVDHAIDGASLETQSEGNQTPQTKPTTNTSSGSPAVNSPGATV